MRKAFTLIELLVVIAVIGALAGLMVPVLTKARATARQVRCTTNLRQWGIALVLYMNDYDGYIPRRGQGVRELTRIDRDEDWFNALPPYVDQPRFRELVETGTPSQPGDDSIFVCPEAEYTDGKYFLSYAMNMKLSHWNQLFPHNINDIEHPQNVVFLADGPGAYSSTEPSTEPYSPVARHRGKVNILFLNGSVRAFSGEYVGCKASDPGRPDIVWQP